MTIGEYLKYTRSLREMSSPESIYDVDQFTETLRASGFTDVHLHITYSTDCVSEVVELDGKIYLVHDRYLGQRLNMLNRIFFHSTEAKDAAMYASKVIGERLMMAGAHIKAIGFFSFYESLHEKCVSYKQNNNLFWRLLTTQAQEEFVILHELAHYLFFSRRLDEGLITRKADDLRESLGGHKNFSDMEELFVRNLTPGLDEGSYIRHRRYDPWDFSNLDAERLDEILRQVPNFAEECLCDEFAVQFMVEKLNKLALGTEGYAAQLDHVLAAVPLLFQHVEILRWLKKIAECIADDSPLPLLSDDVIRCRVFHFWHTLRAQFSERLFIQIMQRENGRIFSEKFDQTLRTPIKNWVDTDVPTLLGR
jgi:hypothetical protein